MYFGLFVLALLIVPQDRADAGCGLGIGVYAFGTSGAHIQSLQNCLISSGYAIPAGASGYYGEQTKQAVQKFYVEKLGLPSWSGLSVGPMGREKLGTVGTTNNAYKKAGSESEFKKYLTEYTNYEKRAFMNPMLSDDSASFESDDSADFESPAPGESKSSSVPSRVSETTVQIAGVDEPDIVKTDGQNIFFSQMQWYFRDPMPLLGESDDMVGSDRMIMPPTNQGSTRVFSAFPPEALDLKTKITETGDLLLDKESNTLMVLSYPEIVAYDVRVASAPKKIWNLKISDHTSVVTARLTDGRVYLLTETWIDSGHPCPMPLTSGTQSISIPCSDIYVPMVVEPVSRTYTVMQVSPTTGKVEDTLAIAGDGGMTTVMVSKNTMYLATHSYSDNTEVMIAILRQVADTYLSSEARASIAKISGYDISLGGKLSEIQLVIENAWSSLSPEARLTAQTNFNNDVMKELTKRQRDLETTRIVRIPLSTLEVAATGKVPGTLLNQFSMDEYNGDLRVSTTVGENNWWFGWGTNAQSVSDVYVLGPNLEKKGEVLDLGKGERIYSTRFMGDQGYVVTFRQIDPFYVLDLSNPNAPRLAGELKIPGYSSYLEKISNDLVLGVGRENNSVKLSLFDVSNPASPKEVSKYLLKDEWSDVESNHHAFMHDAEHKTFFIPGGQGGYFFSYENKELKLHTTVVANGVSRALFIDKFYYIIGSDTIKVLDLTTWKEVQKLEF